MKNALICLVTAATFLFPLELLSVPQTLSHQGRITDADHQPLGGVVSVRFAIYTESVDGFIERFEELDVACDNGFYTVVPISPTTI